MPERGVPLWGSQTTDEVAALADADPVVVLPLAATEQHGPHLPLSTDLDIGWGLVERAFDHIPRDVAAWVLPPVAVGASQEHAHVAGTLTVTADQMVDLIEGQGIALARYGIRRLVLANSHGGNRYAMEAAGLALRSERGMLVVKASYFRFARPPQSDLPDAEWRHGLHGGAVETSMMMHLRPDLVREERITRFASAGEELERTMRVLGPEGQASFAWLATDLNSHGVAGDATLATPELGELLVSHYARALADVILDARDFPLDRLRRVSSQ